MSLKETLERAKKSCVHITFYNVLLDFDEQMRIMRVYKFA